MLFATGGVIVENDLVTNVSRLKQNGEQVTKEENQKEFSQIPSDMLDNLIMHETATLVYLYDTINDITFIVAWLVCTLRIHTCKHVYNCNKCITPKDVRPGRLILLY